MRLILLGVDLVGTALALELLSAVKLNNDRALPPLVLEVQELILAARWTAILAPWELLKLLAIHSPILFLSWLLLHPREPWLRERELSEVAAPQLEPMK